MNIPTNHLRWPIIFLLFLIAMTRFPGAIMQSMAGNITAEVFEDQFETRSH